ncbi:MAG TPA: NUDIX hydrolase [Alphaproteobacteria bacterium]|nr:NUDIX hydrolase [Alphaproteobacteria bacterium]
MSRLAAPASRLFLLLLSTMHPNAHPSAQGRPRMSSHEDNPWTTLKSSRGYDNPWIEVIHNEVLNPSGQPGVYGVVKFKNLAVGVLPIDQAGATYLVGQFRYPLGRYSWEIPEGGCRHGNDPLFDAQRELREETGLVARHWRPLLEMHLSNSVTDERAVTYLAYDLVQKEPQPDDDERLAIRRLPFAEALEMALRGEITDAISVASILRLQVMAGRRELPDEVTHVLSI